MRTPYVQLLLIACMACACSPSVRGEFSVGECRDDGYDDDGDGYTDCADPDCWIYDFCAAEADAAVSTKWNDLIGDSGARTDADAPAKTAIPLSDDDAGAPLGPEDAAVDPGCPVTPCAAPLVCAQGACVAPEPTSSQTYLVSISSAALPSRRADGTCFDLVTSDPSCPLCNPCPPDPYVEVSLNGKVEATTPTVQDRVGPAWQGFDFTLTLAPTDELRFIVKDDDPVFIDEIIFSCRPDLAGLAEYTLVYCTPPAGAYDIMDPPSGQQWSVIATFDPQPTAAKNPD